MNAFVKEAALTLGASSVAILVLLGILEYVPEGQFQGRLLLLWVASILLVPLAAKKISRYVRDRRGTDRS